MMNGILALILYATSEGSGVHAHARCLARAFATRSLENGIR